MSKIITADEVHDRFFSVAGVNLQPHNIENNNLVKKRISDQKYIRTDFADIVIESGKASCVLKQDPNEFLKNLKIESGRLDKIEYIDLFIGGQRVDRVYSNVFDIMSKLAHCDEHLKTDGYTTVPFEYLLFGVPYLQYHDIKIIISFDTDQVDCSLEKFLCYDIYSRFCDVGESIEIFLFNQHQDQKFTDADFKHNRCELNFIHPVCSLVVKYTDGKSRPLQLILHDLVPYELPYKLHLDPEKEFLYTQNATFAQDGYCVYVLPRPFNFSRIPAVYVVGKVLEVYCTNFQIFRCGHGMSGLGFAG